MRVGRSYLPSPVLTGSGSTGLISAASAAPRCRQANSPSLAGVRLLASLGLVGIWHAAAGLGGPLAVTAAFTLGAAALGAWAIAVLRET